MAARLVIRVARMSPTGSAGRVRPGVDESVGETVGEMRVRGADMD